MRKISLGKAVASAPIALGCMRLAGMTVQAAEKLINTALEQGIDLFDHADIYGGGESERLFGEVLRRSPGMRQRMQIQGKCGICKGYYDASKEHILEAVDGSLKRLGVDSLDLLLLHRPDALMEPEEIAQAFLTLEQSGKVRYFGVSNQNAGQLSLLDQVMPGKLAVNQLQFGLAHTGPVDTGLNVNTLNDQAVLRDDGVLDYCRLHRITLQAWSPFQQGWFEGPFLSSEKYAELNRLIRQMAQDKGVTDVAIAVAWILRHPARIQTIVGTTSAHRLTDICRAATVELSRPEWYALYLAAGNPLP